MERINKIKKKEKEKEFILPGITYPLSIDEVTSVDL